MNKPYIQAQNIVKTFDEGRITALNGADITVDEGEFAVIMGPSGSGKSTLLHIIGALEVPDSGSVHVRGDSLARYKNLARYRSHEVGFIFQLHNLIPSLTAVENVQIPMFEADISRTERERRAHELLELVGLAHRSGNVPTKLSGGERQRVAVARALANDPPLILADEPTGSLDSENVDEVLKLLTEIHEKEGKTIVMVTHDKHVATYANRTIKMLDGKVVDHGYKSDKNPIQKLLDNFGQ